MEVYYYISFKYRFVIYIYLYLLTNMKKISLFLICIIITLVSCIDVKKKLDNSVNLNKYELIKTDTIKKIVLDEETKYNLNYLYLFKNDTIECLSFLNYSFNQILFYNFKTCELLFKIDLERDGPNGVGLASGYYIKDFDNIYVSSYSYPGLLKIDIDGKIVQKINYGRTEDGYQIIPSYTPSSYPSIEPVFINNSVYLCQNAVPHLNDIKETPLTVSIDTLSGKSKSYPLKYDIFKPNKDKNKISSTLFSRVICDSSFIYSPFTDEHIYITSINHSKIKKIKAGSNYIKDPSKEQTRIPQIGAKENLELARYGNLIYDKYRNVYYRFAYHKTTLEKKINWIGHAVYGRKKFSIIILNSDFQIIGETLFPEEIYNSYVAFVHKDGLYLSKDYQKNFEESEDYATFELFKLKQL